jgi:hypothetical protein
LWAACIVNLLNVRFMNEDGVIRGSEIGVRDASQIKLVAPHRFAAGALRD